jgi:hypothetical protein
MTMRAPVLLTTLLLCTSLLSCRNSADGEWHGKIADREGIKHVTNEGNGVDAGKVTEEVKAIWTYGSPQSGAQMMWVDFDRAGNVFALDYRDQKVLKLDRNGALQGELGTRGQGPGQLSKSRRFAWVDGRLYFANEGNGRIEVLGEKGDGGSSVELPDVDRPGELYFANDKFYVARRFVANGSFVHAYDRNWKLASAIHPADKQEDRLDFLRSFNTVCPAKDGVWIVYMMMNRIQKVGWDGKVLLETSRDLDWKFPVDNKTGKVIPEILVHRACAVDPSGNLYVVYSNPENWKRGNDVYKFGPDGRLRQKAFTLPIFNATMIRFDGDGNLFFSDGATLTKAKIERRSAS